MKGIITIGAALLLAGCSAKAVRPEAAAVQIMPDRPPATCQALGEAIGSQGNGLTGGWTSDKNLMAGARNDLRNQAADMGGNYVWMQTAANTGRWGGSGASSSTVIGQVYRCP